MADPMQAEFGAVRFSEEVIRRWAGMLPDLVEDAGMLHCQMGHLADGLRQASDRGDRAIAQSMLDFLEEVLLRPDASSEIENAVAISFLQWQELAELDVGDTVPTLTAVLAAQAQRDAST